MNSEPMSVEQLKAEIERHQKNLQVLNQAIAKKVEEEKSSVVKEDNTKYIYDK